jgi:hypothetical protein
MRARGAVYNKDVLVAKRLELLLFLDVASIFKPDLAVGFSF